jgi:hypothetical protein
MAYSSLFLGFHTAPLENIEFCTKPRKLLNRVWKLGYLRLDRVVRSALLDISAATIDPLLRACTCRLAINKSFGMRL